MVGQILVGYLGDMYVHTFQQKNDLSILTEAGLVVAGV
jgi:hypothetical protein